MSTVGGLPVEVLLAGGYMLLLLLAALALTRWAGRRSYSRARGRTGLARWPAQGQPGLL
jgi:hypothetical protein